MGSGRPDLVELMLSNGLYAGYYEYIGMDAVKLLSHQQQDFISMCLILTLKGAVRNKTSCLPSMARIKPLYSPEYWACYTIEYLYDGDASLLAYGISVILYLDNFMEDIPDLLGKKWWHLSQHLGSIQKAQWFSKEGGGSTSNVSLFVRPKHHWFVFAYFLFWESLIFLNTPL